MLRVMRFRIPQFPAWVHAWFFHHENNKVLLPKTWIFLNPKDLDISEPLDVCEQFLTLCVVNLKKTCEVS